ncbi:enoyl-acyl-carrier-proteinreductase 1 mitochondrial precursor [Didymella exigua CBS 183.55]|uniref:enoyl-[acyl-carrier-protein] reductase n=1 Tax=Didymella exigua CBS 183.55 TaxID=1150837 RepID=A0A6A5RX64_9PLEO|nr:enoyl-acyl-carrier-proteinreductase 1 mitochondrial precursor [Didymella exigua CBS 183.55]KAF1933075.1 enoyl-acyl-carrier-proteinreductase 1 mitochondrial precursor [Didymella exigua CBS 183.55]
MASRLLSPAPAMARTCARSSRFAARLAIAPLAPLAQRRSISAYGYEQAKALTFSEYGEPPSVLALHGHSISPPHGDRMTLRFLASPINPADINQIQGVYPSKPTFTTDLGTPHPIAVAGNEGVAEVTALGDGAKSAGFKRGDWVFIKAPGFGTWRTHASATVAQVVKLEESMREGISALQAGTVSVNPCTAHRMLRAFTPLQPGEWFVQNGANSGVGRAAIQLGRKWGLKSLNVVRGRDSDAADAKLKADLTALGADVVLTDAELQAPGLRDRVKEWTNGGGERIGLALNCVNGKPAVAMAKLLSPSAHFVTYGAMSKQPLTIPASMLIFKDIHFHGFWVSRWAEQNPAEKLEAVAEVLELTRSGEFKDTPFDQITWSHDTGGDELIAKVKGTLEGYREGKGVFVFGET